MKLTNSITLCRVKQPEGCLIVQMAQQNKIKLGEFMKTVFKLTEQLKVVTDGDDLFIQCPSNYKDGNLSSDDLLKSFAMAINYGVTGVNKSSKTTNKNGIRTIKVVLSTFDEWFNKKASLDPNFENRMQTVKFMFGIPSVEEGLDWSKFMEPQTKPIKKQKFKLTSETKSWLGHTLFRIEALIDFADVKAGDKGGWVDSADVLDQTDESWIYNGSYVYNSSRVCNNSRVYNSIVDNSCVENSRVENSSIYNGSDVDDSCVDNSSVYNSYVENSRVENSSIYNGSHVDNSYVYNGSDVDDSRVENSCVYNSCVENSCVDRDTNSRDSLVTVGLIGSRKGTTTYNIEADRVKCGCFSGTLEEFKKKVTDEYEEDNKHYREYQAAIQLFEVRKELFNFNDVPSKEN